MKNHNILEISSVGKHHDLIQVHYEKSSLNEQKLFNFFIYAIKNKELDNNSFITSYREINEFLGFKINYKKLKENFINLMGIVLEVAILNKDKKAYKLTHFINEFKYEDGIINIQFSNEFISMVLNDKDSYRTLNFALINQFKSKYTIRLYENITRYMTRDNPYIHMPKMKIKTFKKLMGIKEKQYQRITHLKDAVIDIAVNEIDSKTDIKISYKLFKSANTYTDILFYSKFKNKSQYVIEPSFFYDNKKLFDFIDIFLPKYANKKVVGFIDNKSVYFHKINKYGGKKLILKDTIGETTLDLHIAMEVLTNCYNNRKTFDWFDSEEYSLFCAKMETKKYTESFK